MEKLKRISQAELDEIIELHKKWLNNEPSGKKADLSYYDLSWLDLSCRDLRWVVFRYADLSWANLRSANLTGSDLSEVNLNSANLIDANLKEANLTGANLIGANLRWANFTGTNLKGADLSYADLTSTKFSKNEECRKGIILTQKTKGYKRCGCQMVELEIPVGAVVFSINNDQCRTNIAKVISIDGDKTKGMQVASYYDGSFIYEVGKTAIAKDFNTMYNIEYGGGIHFFYDKERAEKCINW